MENDNDDDFDVTRASPEEIRAFARARNEEEAAAPRGACDYHDGNGPQCEVMSEAKCNKLNGAWQEGEMC